MALARVTLAGVAQLVEQLIRNQQVTSSSLVAGSKNVNKYGLLCVPWCAGFPPLRVWVAHG
jgi:hypothetical protein